MEGESAVAHAAEVESAAAVVHAGTGAGAAASAASLASSTVRASPTTSTSASAPESVDSLRGPSHGTRLAVFAALLLALALDELPDAPVVAALWHARGVVGGGDSASSASFEAAAAAAENVALWLQPGPGLHSGAEISRDGGGGDGSGACSDAPLAVQLTGGLGNHLFGAAFGVALSLQRSGSLAGLTLLRVNGLDLRASQVHPLEHTLFARFAFAADGSEWTAATNARRANASAAATASGGVATASGGVTTFGDVSSIYNIGMSDWRNFCFDYSRERVDAWATAPCGAAQLAEGYFQNALFFGNESALIQRLFAVPEAVAREFRAQYPPPHVGGGGHKTSAGPRSGVPWAIHVRRGDYVEKAEWHHLLPLTYFAEGIFRMLAHLEAAGAGGGPVFVFSDDIGWVRNQEVFRDLEGAIFVEERDPLRAFYMLALAAEGGVLCSNSSYCWWAAFLSELRRRTRPARLVFFPDRWTAAHTLSGSLGPADCGNALRMPYMSILDGFRRRG